MQPVFSSHGTNLSRVRRLRGFTLIEIMITIAILAVIAAIAYPAYTEQVRKARRADAVASLMATAQYLERCFTRYNQYNSADCAAPSTDSIDEYYTISVTRDATSFEIEAEPQGDQQNDPCGTLTLDHLGNKEPVPGANRCWGQS